MNATFRPRWTATFAIVVIGLLLASMVLSLNAIASPSGPGGPGSGAPAASELASVPTPAHSAATTAPTTTRVTPSANGSPHPGEIISYEAAPGGATTEDPSVAYDTVSVEPILNVYQTLVTYNGSSTASYLPQLSLCVPGPACAAKYGGNMLIVNNPTTNQPEYWTFPIDPAARFYDPATGANWSVYPSDVAFTMARTCGFADLPGFGAQPGWIQCQALLPSGNFGWDSHIHQPYNNTPQNVLGSMLINNTTYCPASAMKENGCVTFNAWGGGAAWPFFLELMADPLGASIEPCGWFTAQGAGVPGFAGTNAPRGDGPCLLPGHATSTSQTRFTNWLRKTPATYWDAFEELALNTPGIQPGVRWNMVGSGPYYLTNQPFQQSVGYLLAQNPAYRAPTGCRGHVNCEPLPGPTHYVANVWVIYEGNDATGITAYQNGTADVATILSGETAAMLQLEDEGKIGLLTSPTLSIFFMPLALEFNVAAAKKLDPNTLNVPGDFFDYVGLREFLVNVFPYNTTENTIFTTDGIQYGANYGGAIPRHMGDYYPTNISWPSGDPVSNPSINGSAAWWWAQATNPASPSYDPELAGCTTSSPCQFPIIGQNNSTESNQMIQDYLPYIGSISGGRLSPNTFNVSFAELVVGSLSALPGQSSLPFFNLGWAVDYPDPTDYMGAMYYANATYTSGDAVEQGLSLYTCTNDNGGPADPASMAGLLYWAKLGPIPQACQGNAYAAMEWGMATSAGMAVGPARVLMYNLVEHIANRLALYVYFDQESLVDTYAKWINHARINTNVMVGGGGDQTWYLWAYETKVANVYFNETGLPSGTTFSVTYAGTMCSGVAGATSGSILVPTQTAGTYPYSVSYVHGYRVNLANGTVTVTPPIRASVTTVYSSYRGGATLRFHETGLPPGTLWTTIVSGMGSITNGSSRQSYKIPASGNPYTFYIGISVGYSPSPQTGTASTGSTLDISFMTLIQDGVRSNSVASGPSPSPSVTAAAVDHTYASPILGTWGSESRP